MNLYIYIYTHTWVNIYMYACMNVRTCTRMNIHVYTCMNVNTAHVGTFICNTKGVLSNITVWGVDFAKITDPAFWLAVFLRIRPLVKSSHYGLENRPLGNAQRTARCMHSYVHVRACIDMWVCTQRGCDSNRGWTCISTPRKGNSRYERHTNVPLCACLHQC